MYLTLSPCEICAKAIINAGIAEVIYLERYEQSNGIDILKDAGITVRHLNISGEYIEESSS